MYVSSFDINNHIEYKNIEARNIHHFKGMLPSYTMSNFNKIYLLIVKPKLFKEYFIGRCIIADITKLNDEDQIRFMSQLHNIPVDIMTKYPIIIEDIYINPYNRGKGFGKMLTEFVLMDIGNTKISLKAQGDGLWFWEKYGFQSVGNDVFIRN